jgi:REP element-mobilizing transposase RayT
MVREIWEAMPHHYASVEVDSFVVMPDHVHGVLWLRPMPGGLRVLSLADIVRQFKTLTTRRYIDGVRHAGWPSFERRLWHRNYYDRIVRDERGLRRIREYIAANPACTRRGD